MELINLYNREDAEKDLAKGVSHIEASKKKWEAIQRALARLDTIVSQDCGLCIKYKPGPGDLGGYPESSGNCPLYTKDAPQFCGHTFSGIVHSLDYLRDATAKFLRELEAVEEKEKKPEFKPVTLTLDTEREAILVWHMFNRGSGEFVRQYCKEQGVAPPALYEEADLRRKFSTQYSPNRPHDRKIQ